MTLVAWLSWALIRKQTEQAHVIKTLSRAPPQATFQLVLQIPTLYEFFPRFSSVMDYYVEMQAEINHDVLSQQ